MKLLRAFIAIEIPTHIHQKIAAQTASLRENIASSLVRWVPIVNIHLTLKFLGDVLPAKTEQLSQMLDELAHSYKAHEIQISGLGAFPNPRQVRIIWIGIQAPDTLHTLQTGLETASAKLGFPPENRPFHPHLTLGRVKQGISPAGAQSIQAALANTKIGHIGTVRIEALHLFKSDLKPSGAVYTKLYSAPLSDIQTR